MMNIELMNINFLTGLKKMEKNKTREEGYTQIKECADQGLLEAQVEVGNLFNFGKGRGTWDEAINYYKMASEQGSSYADYCLAICYYRTRWEETINDNEKDENGFNLSRLVFKTAGDVEEYLLKSANAGYKQAQFELGVSYLEGNDIIKQNREEGFEWLKIASENGSEEATELLKKL